MPINEIKALLIQVITSWQVIVATVAVALYISLVSYIARLRYRIRNPSVSKTKRAKGGGAKKVAAAEAELGEGDDLGLEEE